MNRRTTKPLVCAAATAFVAGAVTVALATLYPVASADARVLAPKDDHGHGHSHGDHCDHTGTLVDVARKSGQFNTLAAAIAQAELEEALSHDEYTLFAPTDEAFAKLPPEALEDLLKPENKDKLKAVLVNHVVKGKVHSADATAEGKSLETIGGGKLPVLRSADGKVTIGGATVVVADVEASNGVIHGIDTVLLPH